VVEGFEGVVVGRARKIEWEGDVWIRFRTSSSLAWNLLIGLIRMRINRETKYCHDSRETKYCPEYLNFLISLEFDLVIVKGLSLI
jgi:hypothetical protein